VLANIGELALDLEVVGKVGERFGGEVGVDITDRVEESVGLELGSIGGREVARSAVQSV
jgi:hypothetical protein